MLFFLSAGSYSSWRSQRQMLEPGYGGASERLPQILKVKVIRIMGLKIINQGVKRCDLKVTHNYNGESSEAAEPGSSPQSEPLTPE